MEVILETSAGPLSPWCQRARAALNNADSGTCKSYEHAHTFVLFGVHIKEPLLIWFTFLRDFKRPFCAADVKLYSSGIGQKRSNMMIHKYVQPSASGNYFTSSLFRFHFRKILQVQMAEPFFFFFLSCENSLCECVWAL